MLVYRGIEKGKNMSKRPYEEYKFLGVDTYVLERGHLEPMYVRSAQILQLFPH